MPLFNNLLAHVFLQNFGDGDAAVSLLVVFHNGDDYTRQRQPGAVQGMHELWLAVGGGAVAYVGAPCLEIPAVGAGAYLQPLLAARRPDFNVIGTAGSKAQVGGTQMFQAVGQLQLAADVFGVVYHFIQFVVGTLWLYKLVKLYLVELVASFNTPRILAGRHLFPSEAGGISDIIYGQHTRGYYLFAVHIGKWHFRRWHELQVILFIVVEVIGELGQVAGADHTLLLDHKRRVDFTIAVIMAVQVKHKVYKRSL